jgi:hypothetical protein
VVVCAGANADLRTATTERSLTCAIQDSKIQIHMKMLLGLSETLPSLVEAKFKAAKASQALLFSSTVLAIVRTSAGVPVRHLQWAH